ncbi:peptidoglycan hydrolase-like protein with peptidoglycan-binding domain [Kitasatospora sp. MAA4]|uniref:glycoside hydrolase domain-containing protein n=1 Tax=Kitasatospora sp. MAA4 TaxID=3035093 RepID=UPI0024761E55|nr:glycoside hydrolase domain-containing protein [Kitasatospora sp. MAA4]MDH6137698.1 peptidoglycan hydrolase-like protein with peptidoglycan-binding domain [Kitasatospora sp. MAA4]
MADEKVLAAQKWVNATYASVPGYTKCPEDGRTGWSTMFSLTMGLQAELGISPVVASFGPGTLAKLAARGDIGSNEPNANIRRIIQHGLFCKGYWGGDGKGTYDALTGQSVAKLKIDAGLDGTNAMMQPKLFKALLTMDAYVMLAGGSDKVREIQRWLNGRYVNRSTFFVGPCDGHYSRDVQKALMRAIQYEAGIPDDQVTGTFGPATQAALKTRTVKQGDSGIFVQLISAACVFNEPVTLPTGSFVTSFKSSFDSKLREFVEAFQAFSVLGVNGTGDYGTWTQLLLSTGDPDRAVQACDTRFTITASRAKSLHDAGYRYVGRYLYDPPGSTLDKAIKPGELQDIFQAGLRVFPIYQDNARKLADFTYTQGFQHALKAHELASGHGFNRGTVIYFAVDYDATDPEIASNIVPYFNGVYAGLANRGRTYVHGVYGSRNVCATVTKETYARYSFVSGMSWGFSGNLGFPLPPNWAFNQIKEFKYAAGADTFDLDNDAHRPGSDEGQSSVNQLVDPAGDFIAYIQQLYGLAVQYAKGDPNRLVMEYVRHLGYADFTWWALIGDPDQGFITYADDHGMRVWKEFEDPYTGFDLDAQHLMATANGHYVKPQSSDLRTTGAGDVGGWGGDLITLYGEWRRDSDSYSSGYTYCMDKFAKIGVSSTFSYDDLLEDADGYLIAERCRSTDIATAVREHYSGPGGLTRFRDYYARRFGNTAGAAADIARSMLTTQVDPVIAAGRQLLIDKIAGPLTLMPSNLPEAKLTEFCKGFGDSLQSRVGLENAQRSALAAAQQRSPAAS